MPVRNAEDAHVAMKYLTGLYDSYAVKGGVVRLLKSTALDPESVPKAYENRLTDPSGVYQDGHASSTEIAANAARPCPPLDRSIVRPGKMQCDCTEVKSEAVR